MFFKAEARPLRIDLIDDDPTECIFFEEAFESQPRRYHLHYSNGADAALQRLEHHTPDLIIMDVRMPRMSGLDALIEIRNRSSLDQTPVFMISGSIVPQEQEIALARGAHGIYKKPISPDGYSVLLTQILDEFSAARLARALA